MRLIPRKFSRLPPYSFIIFLLAHVANAALTSDQTATMSFGNVPTAVAGWANENNTGTKTGGCQNAACYLQNGIVAGVVRDPLDSGAHFHKAQYNLPNGSSTVTSQYHPDSTGIYIRMADLSRFSLMKLDLDLTYTESGGNIVIYGYDLALNPSILSDNGSQTIGADSIPKWNPTDPEGGNVPYLTRYIIPNDNTFSGSISLAQLMNDNPKWSNISSFWITFENFNHSPTMSYPATAYDPNTDITELPYPAFDIRIDNIVLGAACEPSLQITIQ